MLLLLFDEDTTMSKLDPTDPQYGAQQARFGAQKYQPFQFVDRDVSAVQTKPTSELQCLEVRRFTHVQHAIIMPAGVTAYEVTYGRWIYCQGKGGTPVETFVVEGTRNYTDSATFTQETRGDLVRAYITQITGAPSGDGFDVAYRGLNLPGR